MLLCFPFSASLDLAAGCDVESTDCPVLSSVTEVSASVQNECPPLPGSLYVFINVYKHLLLQGERCQDLIIWPYLDNSGTYQETSDIYDM